MSISEENRLGHNARATNTFHHFQARVTAARRPLGRLLGAIASAGLGIGSIVTACSTEEAEDPVGYSEETALSMSALTAEVRPGTTIFRQTRVRVGQCDLYGNGCSVETRWTPVNNNTCSATPTSGAVYPEVIAGVQDCQALGTTLVNEYNRQHPAQAGLATFTATQSTATGCAVCDGPDCCYSAGSTPTYGGSIPITKCVVPGTSTLCTSTPCCSQTGSTYSCKQVGQAFDLNDISFCSVTLNVASGPATKDWTFLVYMNGDNNLESYAFSDLAEMRAVGSTVNANVVVLLDTSSTANQYGGRGVRLLVNTNAEPTVIQDLGEIDMGRWETLGEFGAWAVTRFPANKYALTLWDHGSGWRAAEASSLTKAFSNDDHGTAAGIRISDGSYARALAQITTTLGRKLDVVGFDACLMGMFEVAAATVPYANYLVASEETEPGNGWAYNRFLGNIANTTGTTALALSRSIVDAYATGTSGAATLSVTDLAQNSALGGALSQLANALMAHPTLYPTIDQIRAATQTFYYSAHRDIGDFVRRLNASSAMTADIRAAATAVQAALAADVVYVRNSSSYSNATGLAVYFPQRGAAFDSAYTLAGAVWSQQTTWDEFLTSFR